MSKNILGKLWERISKPTETVSDHQEDKVPGQMGVVGENIRCEIAEHRKKLSAIRTECKGYFDKPKSIGRKPDEAMQFFGLENAYFSKIKERIEDWLDDLPLEVRDNSDLEERGKVFLEMIVGMIKSNEMNIDTIRIVENTRNLINERNLSFVDAVTKMDQLSQEYGVSFDDLCEALRQGTSCTSAEMENFKLLAKTGEVKH